MDQLGVQFSCSNHVRRATELHSFYSNKINKRQREMGHEPLDLEGPLYKCAALVAAAKVNCSVSQCCLALKPVPAQTPEYTSSIR